MREEAVTFSGGADGAVDVVCGGEGEGGGIQKFMCIDLMTIL